MLYVVILFIAVTIVANKYDKIKPSNRDKTLKNIKAVLNLDENDHVIYFSSVNKKGRDEVGKVIAEHLK